MSKTQALSPIWWRQQVDLSMSDDHQTNISTTHRTHHRSGCRLVDTVVACLSSSGILLSEGHWPIYTDRGI